MPSIAYRHHHASPLAHSTLTVTITDLVAEYELRHAFRNEGSDPIEAVYSFPVPLDSAFMGMEATLAGERRVAQVQPRAQANQKYDEAIAGGDSAVLLERLEPGMLCVSLGNLAPGEDGEVVLRFAAPLHCAGGAARFSLPLVHRPRYGRSRLDEIVEPRHDFAVEHPLEATIRVCGLLAHAPVGCAAHAARFAADGDGQTLQLNQAMLDRDIVLVFELPQGFAGQARLVRDGDAAIGMLSFNVPEAVGNAGPCELCLVLDGSGSMTGDAIAQSRAALSAVADLLGDDDRVYVLRFGSTTVPLFRRPLKATARVRAAMQELAGTIDSDLGGTEIGAALENAMNALAGLKAPAGRSQAIILVTDGAVQPGEIEDAQAKAHELGIRIFVVAVGSSAGVDVLAPLAAATDGVLERAVPAEPIDEAVVRELRRARQAAPANIEIDWHCAQATPLPIAPAYAGDAVTAIAMLPVGQSLTADIRIDGGAMQTFSLGAVEDAPALRAIAGHAAWQHAAVDVKKALALRYGLVTDGTSAVLVKVRAEGDKIHGLPKVVPVTHMIPEAMLAAASVPHVAMRMARSVSSSHVAEYLDIPAFLRRSEDDTQDERPEPSLTPKAHDALLRVLIELLLGDDQSDVTLDLVLARIDHALREPVSAYLKYQCRAGIDTESAAMLLEALMADAPGIELDDDQEVRWALIRPTALL